MLRLPDLLVAEFGAISFADAAVLVVELDPVIYIVEGRRIGTELCALTFVAGLGLWRSRL